MTADRTVAMVMPPVADQPFADVVARWTTVTATCAALRSLPPPDDGPHAGRSLRPVVHGRHRDMAGSIEHEGVRYEFHTSDEALAAAVGASAPWVVHVHGLGWTRLLRRLGRLGLPLVAQHHGEPVLRGRSALGHRLVRRYVGAYLFTGADHGQATPWFDAGVLARGARVCEVLEAASMVPPAAAPVTLEGAPVVLWVGRLVEGKDPLTAVDAFALACAALPGAHLHLLATDRDLEPAVRARIAAHGGLAERIHLHPPVGRDEIAAWYEAADVFFSTSHHEGSGYALIEAMTCGSVPAVTAIPSHRAIVGGLGATFRPGDVGAAARALAAASASSRKPIQEWGRTQLSWGAVARQLAAAYSTVAD